MDQDVDSLLAQLTLDEKISLLAGLDSWHTSPVERLGIPSLKLTDGPNGARGAWGCLALPSACTPVGVALAATWNPALIEQVGALLGEEARAKDADLLLAPTVNLHRTPLAGRNFECFSEDPYLSGEMASAYIRGVQSRGVGCCIKHFVCNDQEYQRFSISAEVEERPLRELYLEPFRKAIQTARPWAVMTAYNRLRGVYASEHDVLLKDILKGEWGFDGLAISDWGGTYSERVPAGGLDLEMPGPARWMKPEQVQKALAEGRLTLEALDDKVRRLLRVLFKAGRFARPRPLPERGLDTPEQRRLLRQAAREAIVLLKNRGALPLKNVRQIAVVGENARWPVIMGGGSSMVVPYYAVSPLQGIRRRAGDRIVVKYAIGAFAHRFPPFPEREAMQTDDGQPGWMLEIFDRQSPSGVPVHRRRIFHPVLNFGDLPGQLLTRPAMSARLRGRFLPQESGVHKFALETTGQAEFNINGRRVLALSSATGQSETTEAEATLQVGEACECEIVYRAPDRQNPGWLRLGCLPPHSQDLLAEALALARESDAAILIAGLAPDWESEGFDRLDMRLPGRQDELIHRIAEVNPNTIVVLNSGSPLEMPWLEDVNAVVQLWYAGQEQGNALADILFGDVSPSGKLPVTFPRRLKDNPAYLNYPGENGRVVYGEGLFTGYRYYDSVEQEALFPFGHGLSYNRFEYSDLRISPAEFREGETIEVSFSVANRGRKKAMETAQIYVRDVYATLARPLKELKGFIKVELEPDETKRVSVTLDQEAFWFYDPARCGWVTESGLFQILVGASSRDIRLQGQARLLSSDGQSSRWGLHSRLKDLLANGRSAALVQRYLGRLLETTRIQDLLELTVEEIGLKFPELTPKNLLLSMKEELTQLS